MISLSFWGIFAAIATVSSAVSAAVLGACKITKSWLQQLIAWVIAIALSFAAWGLHLFPAITSPEWLAILVQGFFVGLVSNGVYDIEAVKKLFALLFGENVPEDTKDTEDEIWRAVEISVPEGKSEQSNVNKMQGYIRDYMYIEDGMAKLTILTKEDK